MERLNALAKLLVVAAEQNDASLVQFVAEEIAELAKLGIFERTVRIPSKRIDEAVLQIFNHNGALNRIAAIKLRRTLTGEGLKEAKDQCDVLLGL